MGKTNPEQSMFEENKESVDILRRGLDQSMFQKGNLVSRYAQENLEPSIFEER